MKDAPLMIVGCSPVRRLNPDRLQAQGFGESKPKATNKTLQGRALNRLVQLVRTDR